MSAQDSPRVLYVDNDPPGVEALLLHLAKEYEVHRASRGDEALKVLKQIGGAAVVVADLRMPDMDGSVLLHNVMVFYPDTTRIGLMADRAGEAAIAAVNKAHVFCILTKPCAPDQLREAVEDGVMQHRLIKAERSVLKETLLGCVKALVGVLAIAHPVSFGRASRVKTLCVDFAAVLECRDFWQLEAAAMLSQLGYLSLPTQLVEKLYHGEPLTSAEKILESGVPNVAITLLENIPGLEPVIQILTALKWSDEQIARLGDGTIGTAGRILGLVLEYDTLMSQGVSVDVAIQTLRRRAPRFTAELIEKFGQHVGAGAGQNEVREMPLRAVLTGMIIMQDVRTQMGTLLVPRGFEVTNLFLERIRNFGPDLLAETVKVLIPAARPAVTPEVPS